MLNFRIRLKQKQLTKKFSETHLPKTSDQFQTFENFLKILKIQINSIFGKVLKSS